MMEMNGTLTGKCSVCDAELFCKTCDKAPECTACFDGYSLFGAKCISDKKVTFSLTMDIKMAQFVPRINNFKSSVMEAMGIPYEGNPQYFTFDTLKNGSVIAEGSLTVPDSSSTSEASSSLRKVLTEKSTYGEITLLKVVIGDGGNVP